MSSPDVDLKDLVIKGPLALEGRFSEITGIPMGLSKDRSDEASLRSYNAYLDLLKTFDQGQRDEWFEFVAAYFNQQAGDSTPSHDAQVNYYKKAIAGYQIFLDPKFELKGDAPYFAQWQIGNMQRFTGQLWPVVEKSYLKAGDYDPERAEALREIILYYADEGLGGLVYSFTAPAVSIYLGKLPAGRVWFINPAFYRWKILKYHIPSTIAVHKKDELVESYQHLMDMYVAHRDEFDAEESHHVDRLRIKYEKAMAEVFFEGS